MTFLQSVREEITGKPLKERAAKKAFIAGVIRGNGNLFYDENGSFGLDFSLKDERAVSFISDCFKDVYGYELRDVSVYQDALNKSDVFTFSINGEKAEKILIDLGVLVKSGEDYGVSLKFYGAPEIPENLRAFFKGLFLSCGRLTVPYGAKSKKTRYHLEFEFSHSAPASDTAAILGKNGVAAGIVRRKNQYVVYLKSGEEMKNFFAFLCLPAAVLKITDLMVNGEMTNMINRRKNCDIGNVVRQMDAAEKQLSAIKYIETTAGLDYLKKPDLILTAKARLNNPEDSVIELAEKLVISKSCLNHRFRKITALSEQLKTLGNTKE